MSDQQTSEIETTNEDPGLDKSELVRDAVVFQFKLLLDGLIDFVMIPVSFIAALISLVKGDRTFYEAMRTGRSLDRRLNLYGAARRIRRGGQTDDQIEAFARRVEADIRREFRADTLQKDFKLDALQNAVKKTFEKVSESFKKPTGPDKNGADNG
ncbi:MAG: hypothetical protein AAF385_02590 [Pseudomonadota bacterium]